MSMRSICAGLLVGASCLAVSLPAVADTVTINDGYFGGLNTYNNSPVTAGSDVIGNSDFQVTKADVTRTGSDLQVVVYTNFVNHIGEDGVGLGALFLGNGSPTYNNTVNGSGVSAPYAYDQFTNDTGRFSLAVGLPSPVSTGGAATLYSLDGTGGDVQLSNVYNDQVTYPFAGNNGYYFRQNQAVGVKTTGADPAHALGNTASYSIDNVNSTLTFNVANVFGTAANQLQDTFTLAWAMTCANDVILATTTLNANTTTPIPASLPLFLSGAGVLGLIGRNRRRKAAEALA